MLQHVVAFYIQWQTICLRTNYMRYTVISLLYSINYLYVDKVCDKISVICLLVNILCIKFYSRLNSRQSLAQFWITQCLGQQNVWLLPLANNLSWPTKPIVLTLTYQLCYFSDAICWHSWRVSLYYGEYVLYLSSNYGLQWSPVSSFTTYC